MPGVQVYSTGTGALVLVHTAIHPSLLTRHFLITTTRHRLALTIVTQFSVSAPFNNDNGCSNEMFFLSSKFNKWRKIPGEIVCWLIETNLLWVVMTQVNGLGFLNLRYF